MKESPNLLHCCQFKRSVHRHSSRPHIAYYLVRTKSLKNADITLLTHSVSAQFAYRSGHQSDWSYVVFLSPLQYTGTTSAAKPMSTDHPKTVHRSNWLISDERHEALENCGSVVLAPIKCPTIYPTFVPFLRIENKFLR